ncbi:MAG: alpha/beta fold hydrolase, partial [Saprospiraceae bacterium]
ARWITEVFLEQDHSKLIPILEACGAESYYDQLSTITIPCAVVIGDKDATTPPFHTNGLVRNIPNATRIDVAGKGHCLNVEAPEEIIAAIQMLDV